MGFKNILNQNTWKIEWKIWVYFIFLAHLKETTFLQTFGILTKIIICFFQMCWKHEMGLYFPLDLSWFLVPNILKPNWTTIAYDYSHSTNFHAVWPIWKSIARQCYGLQKPLNQAASTKRKFDRHWNTAKITSGNFGPWRKCPAATSPSLSAWYKINKNEQ